MLHRFRESGASKENVWFLSSTVSSMILKTMAEDEGIMFKVCFQVTCAVVLTIFQAKLPKSLMLFLGANIK